MFKYIILLSFGLFISSCKTRQNNETAEVRLFASQSQFPKNQKCIAQTFPKSIGTEIAPVTHAFIQIFEKADFSSFIELFNNSWTIKKWIPGKVGTAHVVDLQKNTAITTYQIEVMAPDDVQAKTLAFGQNSGLIVYKEVINGRVLPEISFYSEAYSGHVQNAFTQLSDMRGPTKQHLTLKKLYCIDQRSASAQDVKIYNSYTDHKQITFPDNPIPSVSIREIQEREKRSEEIRKELNKIVLRGIQTPDFILGVHTYEISNPLDLKRYNELAVEFDALNPTLEPVRQFGAHQKMKTVEIGTKGITGQGQFLRYWPEILNQFH